MNFFRRLNAHARISLAKYLRAGLLNDPTEHVLSPEALERVQRLDDIIERAQQELTRIQ